MLSKLGLLMFQTCDFIWGSQEYQRVLGIFLWSTEPGMLKPVVALTCRECSTAAAYRASSNAMEPLIMKNRQKLIFAPKTGDGTTAGGLGCQGEQDLETK